MNNIVLISITYYLFAILLIGLGFMVAVSCFKKLFGKNDDNVMKANA